MPSDSQRRWGSRRTQQTDIPLNPRGPNHWKSIFNKYDVDNDGRISYSELKRMIHSETYENDIPEATVRRIMQKADEDENGYIDYEEFERLQWRGVFDSYDRNKDGQLSVRELAEMIRDGQACEIPLVAAKNLMRMADRDGNKHLDFDEFLKLVQTKEFRSIMGHMLYRYVRSTVVPRYKDSDVVDGRGDYEEEYSCWPPKVCMVIISFVEIALFAWDAFKDDKTDANGPIAMVLLYDPKRRYEAWRYLTYMFVHVGVFHLIVNLLVQLLLGFPLEMVHHWWRVLIIYLGGVVFGSLGTSISDPYVRLAGASGGVYALITAHLASIVMNWSEMRFAPLQLVVFFILTASDVGTAVYNRYIQNEDNRIGYAAHLAGALAGFLLGISVLRNLHWLKWERVLWWVSILTFIGLALAAIVWNAAFPSYFPQQEYST